MTDCVCKHDINKANNKNTLNKMSSLKATNCKGLFLFVMEFRAVTGTVMAASVSVSSKSELFTITDI